MKKVASKNNLIKLFLSFYALLQIYFSKIGGVTYDELGYRFGSKTIIQTLQAILKFDFTLAKSYYSDLEYYGQLLLTPAYLFSHFMSTFVIKGLDYSFISFYSYDDKFYFFSHFFLIIYTSLLLYFIYTLIKSQRNEQFAFLFISFLVLVPIFNGHSLFNLKDIPFALHFFISLLFIDKHASLLKNSYLIENKKIIYFGIIFGSLLNIRINAIPFIGLFILLYLPEIVKKNKLKDYFLSYFKIGSVSVSFLVLLTPSMWIEPISWLKLAIQNQFLLPWPGSTLVNGEFVVATEMTYSYLLTFFFYKLPLNYILLIIVYAGLLITKKNVSNFSQKCLTLLVVINLLFIIFRPTAYDGLRQYLFLVLPMAYIFTETILYFKKKKNILNFVIVLNIFYLISTQSSLAPYNYVYFNELVEENSISLSCENYDGCGNWSTDYWGYSGKNLAKFINNNLEEGFLLVCRPDVSILPYLDDETTNFVYNATVDKPSATKLNYTTTDTTVLKDLKVETFYVASFHRPRLNENSCLLETILKCEDIYIEQTTLRNVKVNVSYLKKCSF